MRLLALVCLLVLGMTQFGFTQEAQEASLLSQWSDPSLEGSSAFDNVYNEIWGLAVNGHEYAIIGSTKGTHFIDVTEPTSPFEAFVIEGRVTGSSIIHRDYHDHKGYLYAVADEGPSSLQIMDISTLPDSVTVEYDSNTLITRSHNIFIDEKQDRLYSCANNGSITGYRALQVFDISDPLGPVPIGGTNNFDGFAVGHVHDAYVDDHIAYLNCGGSGFAIVNMEDFENLELLSSLEPFEYPESGYNHSGWISEDQETYYMADETHNRDLKSIDIRDLSDLKFGELFDAGEESNFSIPHNMIVKGDSLYVSYYYDGLQIYDISSPLDPQRVLYFDTSNIPHQNSYEGAWGVYPLLPSGNVLVSDMQEGLFVIEPVAADPSSVDETISSIKIYPNPVSDILTLDFGSEGVNQFEIYNVGGRLMQTGEKEVGIRQIDVSAFQEGMYLLKIVNDKYHLVYNFVVVK